MSGTRHARGLDGESRSMLYDGLNLSQLGIAFRMDHRVLVEKLRGVEPSGKRGGYATWTISEAAPYLVKPMYDIESYIKKMNHNDLPNHLKKEFWSAQKIKQDFEEKAGHLWKTADVVDKVGELMKLVKMAAKLATDNIERNTELTDRQRDAVNTIMTAMLQDLYEKVLKNFKLPEENNGNQAPRIEDDEF